MVRLYLNGAQIEVASEQVATNLTSEGPPTKVCEVDSGRGFLNVALMTFGEFSTINPSMVHMLS